MCELQQGCILRSKFYSHVTFQEQNGQPLPLKSALNYKIVYIYKDRLVFYTSKKSTENGMELEVESVGPKGVDEEQVERMINFNEIILNCGKFKDKICFAQSYPNIVSVPFFNNIIKKAIPTDPDVKCIVVPFYENSYKLTQDKVAFLCIQDMRQIMDIIEFRNALSRAVESYQMRLAEDRFNAFNGMQRAHASFITYEKNKPLQVIARLYGKRITLVTNDKMASFLKDFSLYQAKETDIYYASDAVAKGIIKKNWSRDFELPATEDCCLIIPGMEEKLVLCAASNDGKDLEKASDICKVKLAHYKTAVSNQIRGIRLSEATYEVLADSRKFKNCKSKAFQIYKARVRDSLEKGAVEDCTIVMNYAEISNEEKMRYCVKHYEDEMKLEINVLANDNSAMYDRLTECLNQDSKFKQILSAKYLKKLLGMVGKPGASKSASFMQTNEIDEIDNDDDGVVQDKKQSGNPKGQKNMATAPSKPDANKLTFTQIKEDVKKEKSPNQNTNKNTNKNKKKSKKSKKKLIEKIMYNKKRIDTPPEMIRKKLYRIKEMNRLQNDHHWRHSPNEGMTGDYSKIIANQGNKNADMFVGFLGFLRDSAYDGSQNIQELETERFFK